MQRIAFIRRELALVTLELAFADVDKLVSGMEVTLSTAVLALVTPVWAFATVGRFRFKYLTFEKQVNVTEYNFRNYAIRWQNVKIFKKNVIFLTYLIFAKVRPV